MKLIGHSQRKENESVEVDVGFDEVIADAWSLPGTIALLSKVATSARKSPRCLVYFWGPCQERPLKNTNHMLVHASVLMYQTTLICL